MSYFYPIFDGELEVTDWSCSADRLKSFDRTTGVGVSIRPCAFLLVLSPLSKKPETIKISGF